MRPRTTRSNRLCFVPRRTRKPARSAALGAAIALVFAVTAHGVAQRVEAAHALHARAAVIRHNAETLCASFGNSRLRAMEPQYTEQCGYLPGGAKRPPEWTVHCTDGREEYDMFFTTGTGELMCIVADYRGTPLAHGRIDGVDISSARMARSVALDYLWRLGLAPRGATARAEGMPSLEELGTAWRLSWSIRSKPAAAPYEVRMLLTRCGGRPLMIVNALTRNRPRPL